MDLEPSVSKDSTTADNSLQKTRACGPVIGFGPGIIGFNADINNVNIFASGSLILPIASEGDYFAFSIGAGKLIKLGSRGWKFNVFSHASVFLYDEYNSGKKAQLENNKVFTTSIGIGVGFQYTTRNGILFSFKVPIVGYSFDRTQEFGDGVSFYYAYSGASLPVIVFGKSF
jgi:hypothetical protein